MQNFDYKRNIYSYVQVCELCFFLNYPKSQNMK
jgi:hypothetical protein